MNEEVTTFGPARGNVMERKPLIANSRSAKWITAHTVGLIEGKPLRIWWILLTISSALALFLPLELTYLVSTGVGIWGSNNTVAWAWDITNFVWWVGIAHAGTAISAIFFLTRQKWTNAINRIAEAMTIFAIGCAGVFPAFHVGRVWMVWFLNPAPYYNDIWQNFKSPLFWDVFAVTAYLTVSALFWYYGMIPDLASVRDKVSGKVRKIAYGIAALGWRGSGRHWFYYEKGYVLLAGICSALVFSVCGIVSMDFATSVIPGWHTTIFPMYFGVGAVYGGFAMLFILIIPTRHFFKLHDLITEKHIDNMCKVTIIMSLCIGYIYLMEYFTAYYSGNPYEWWLVFFNRSTPSGAPYWWCFWIMVSFNAIVPQILWFKAVRRNTLFLFFLMFIPSIGMWYERFVIIVTGIQRDYLPSSWHYFVPTINDVLLYIGTIGFFFTAFLLFLRFLPIFNMVEVKNTLPEANPHHDANHEAKGGSHE
ncbi:MAG: polysulfide reductase NrfD [Verrucomicrobiales bacterium]|jgi:molybdopterin-containing oxidoreductase family membrane subunit|nr:polysulfide reductase NrfD [Verrucomicrobiales bacterium]